MSPEPIVHGAEPEDAGADEDALEPHDGGVDASRARRRRVDAPPTLFDPDEDARVLAELRSEEIISLERGRGGRSVAFRVTLASGARAYFKPEQTFSGTHWNAEIAAFHLDRLLGLNRTAPSTGRVVPWSLLEPILAGDPRASEVVVDADGNVRGVLVAWMDERLIPIAPPAAWERDLRITEHVGAYPFVPPAALLRAHTAFLTLDGGPEEPADAGLEESDAAAQEIDGWDREQRAAEISTLIVFDFLIHNGDRWGGQFTNVRTRGPNGPIVYLDNAAGFSRRRARLTTLDLRLQFVERFETRVVRRLRRLEDGALGERLESDPMAPILDDDQLAHFEERRLALLSHVDGLVERLGEERVLPWR